MLDYYLAVLGPAAVILAIILAIRLRRALRGPAIRAAAETPDWPTEDDIGDPDDTLWRRAYRG